MLVSSNLIIDLNPQDSKKSRVREELIRIKKLYPQFTSYGDVSTITYVTGVLRSKYEVEISVRSGYPYAMPTVKLTNVALPLSCPHIYSDNSICYMHPNQWHPNLSLAFVISKIAIWTAKYEYWLEYHVWPGNHLSH